MAGARVHSWHHLTAGEIKALAGKAVTILPLGSTEQHGPHMVTGTDTILNDLLQKGLVENPPAHGQFLLAPTLPLGTSEHHVPFGGTLTIPPILYTRVLVAMVRSLMQQGHKRIFLLNSHGGNQPSLATAMAELAPQATREGILLGGASYWAFAAAAWKDEIPDLKLKQIGHACEIEASLLMIARPDLPLRSRPEGQAPHEFLGDGWSVAADFSAFTPQGHIGYPQEASEEKGRRLREIALRTLREFLARYAEEPLPHNTRSSK